MTTSFNINHHGSDNKVFIGHQHQHLDHLSCKQVGNIQKCYRLKVPIEKTILGSSLLPFILFIICIYLHNTNIQHDFHIT